MTDRPLGLALIGCGSIAGRHAQALRDIAEARLVVAYDLDAARSAAFAANHGVVAAASLDEALERDDVDAALLTLPATLHAEIGTRALAAGRHVLSEKPLDTDLRRAERFAEAAAAHGRTLSVVSQNRFHDDVLWLQAAAASGAMGRPIAISVFSVWSRDQAYYDAAPGRGRHDPEEGGVLLNQAVHAVDQMLWIFGDARRVTCTRGTLTHELAVEDTAALAIEFASGARGTLLATTSPYVQEPERIEARFEHASVVLSGGRATSFKARDGLRLAPPPGLAEATAARPDVLEPFRRQHRDFARAVRGGLQPLVTARQALAVVRLIHAAYEEDLAAR
jgi:predicted dehydrogenase